MMSATAVEDCSLTKSESRAIKEVLHQEHTFSDMSGYLLGRSVRYQEDIVDQLFNSSDKRLARVLLLLAKFEREGMPETAIPNISQETLAEMVGTTRARVSQFVNKFRKLGFISYDRGGLEVHSLLLDVVLHGLIPQRLGQHS